MQKIILNPICAGTLSLLILLILKGIDLLFYPAGSLDFYEANQGLEIITYIFYGLAGLIACFYAGDFLKTNKQNTFYGLLLLWMAAFLREMGVQHWLTKHDTTAIKIRFFTNPNNPLHEKIISALLVILVLGVALWLFCKYFKKIIRGFFRFNPIYWTVATFGFLGIVSQICDRLPSKYHKATGTYLNGDMLMWLKLLEEGGEACLPILFALGMIQYHMLLRVQKH